jgi:hypothetical protein
MSDKQRGLEFNRPGDVDPERLVEPPERRWGVADHAPSVAWAGSARSGVAAQLARRFSAASDFEPVSAVQANIDSPGSAESSIAS